MFIFSISEFEVVSSFSIVIACFIDGRTCAGYTFFISYFFRLKRNRRVLVHPMPLPFIHSLFHPFIRPRDCYVLYTKYRFVEMSIEANCKVRGLMLLSMKITEGWLK